jgi:hypothetical protein
MVGFSEPKEVDKLHARDLFVIRSHSVYIAHKAVQAVILRRTVTGTYAAYSSFVGLEFQDSKWAMQLIDDLQPGRFNRSAS